MWAGRAGRPSALAVSVTPCILWKIRPGHYGSSTSGLLSVHLVENPIRGAWIFHA